MIVHIARKSGSFEIYESISHVNFNLKSGYLSINTWDSEKPPIKAAILTIEYLEVLSDDGKNHLKVWRALN